MSDFSSSDGKRVSFGTTGAVFSLILLPPMFILTIPATAFSLKAKKLYAKGNTALSEAFAKKAKRYTLAAWAITFIIILSALVLYSISRLSLI